MKKPLHKDDFENYLQHQVGNHRMYPSDQVWRNIQKEIHGEGKWPALTYISIFIITALVISTLMVKPEERLEKNTIAYPASTESKLLGENKEQKTGNAIDAAPLQYAYTDKITQQTLQTVSDIIIARNEQLKAGLPIQINKESLLIIQNKSESEGTANTLVTTAIKPDTKNAEALQVITVNSKSSDAKPANGIVLAVAKPASRYFNTTGLMNLSELKKPSDEENGFNADDFWRNYPLVSTKDLLRQKLSKFSFQFYLTPSVSYRRLTDANGKAAQSFSTLPISSNYRVDINHIVEHRPAMGAEVGFALGYQLTPSLTIKGGFQFNVRQYGIKAYTIPKPDPAILTSAQTTTGTTTPDERNDASYLASADNQAAAGGLVVLNNRYYEVAAPIGIDWRLLSSNNGRLTVNTAVALQPTYTFDKEPFVLTANHKSYANGASIMRNWNVNSNMEAYVSYQVGPFRWQLGPQFRYQHLSTYSNAYPIREHLLDYGVKLGFTKSIY